MKRLALIILPLAALWFAYNQGSTYSTPPAAHPVNVSPAPDPAERLVSIDAGHSVDADDPRGATMRTALKKLQSRGGDADTSLEHVAGVVYTTQRDLAASGFMDTALQVCQHLTQSIPPGMHVDITSTAAAYAVLRESPEGNR